jgi:ABC-type transport system substrate-binding protein
MIRLARMAQPRLALRQHLARRDAYLSNTLGREMFAVPRKADQQEPKLALAAPIAEAQKLGGVLIMSHFDSPASMSMLEDATGAVNRSMMGVFNNLVMYDQHVPQNSLVSIVPDLAMTGWSWNEEGTELTLPLPPGVRANRLPPGMSNAPGTC